MSGGKGGAQVEITKYFMSIHFGICSAADAIKRIIIKEKEAWKGYASALTPIAISDDELFGGDKKEGGVEGLATFLPGDSEQVLPDELATRLGRTGGTDAPGYRGICSIWFTGFGAGGSGKGVSGEGALFDKLFGGGAGFYWSANIPYLPGVWIEIERAPKGLNPSYAMIPRPGTGALESLQPVGVGSLGAKGFSPDGKLLLFAGGTSFQIWDMETLTLVHSGSGIDGNATISAPLTDGSFYIGNSNDTDLAFVNSAGAVTVLDETTMAGGVWVVNAGVFGRHVSGQHLVRQWTGADNIAVSVSFYPSWYADQIDGTSWVIGGGDTGGFIIADLATYTEHFVDVASTDDAQMVANPAGGWFVWQSNGGLSGDAYVIDPETYEVLHGPVAISIAGGDRPFMGSHPSQTSIWFGPVEYSTFDISVLRTVDPSDWPAVGGTGGMFYDRVNNALWGKNIVETDFTIRFLASGVLDANPAHIIYEALTDTDWGMGSPPSAIDVINFDEVGITLYNEPLGLSLIWTSQSKVESFIQEILDHIQAVLFVDPATGLLTLKLIRDDYDEATLPIITPENAVLSNFGRKLWGDIVNEITLTWTNPDSEKEETVTVQDLASIAAQGGIVSDSRNYYGVRYADLAKRLAARDLRSAGAPLATCEAVVDRSFWELRPASVLKAIWPEHGLNEVVMRVVGIDYGKPGDPKIKLSLMEDVFGLDAGDYVSPPSSGFEDPSEPPEPVDSAAIMTLPYFTAANFTDISSAVYPEVLAGVLATTDQVDASIIELWDEVTHPDSSVVWEKLANLNVIGHGLLTDDVPAEASTTLTEIDDYTGRTSPVQGGFVLIGDGAETAAEIGLVTSTGLTYTIARGVLDTVPRAWPAGSSVRFFAISTLIEDPTIRSAAEVVSYKLRPRTSMGLLSLGAASDASATLTDRPWLPSRPANVLAYGADFNTLATAVDATARPDPWVTVTWANRNRVTEDTAVLTWTDADTTPEDGQTTTIRVFDPDLVELAIHDGLTGTSFNVPDASFGTEVVVYLAVSAKRTDADGTFESMQAHGVWVQVRPPAAAAFGVGTASFVSAPVMGGALSVSGVGTASFSVDPQIPGVLSASGVGALAAASNPIVAAALSGSGTATLSAVGQSVTTDANFASVKLLLSGDGVAGTTVFTDESPAAHGTATTSGSFATVSTTIVKYGTGSIRLNGSAGSLNFADHADWTFGASDFTVEMWASFDSTWIESTSSLISHYSTVSNQRGWNCQYRGGDATNNLAFVASSNGSSASFITQGNWTPTADQLYHLVWERSGNTFRQYIDGVMLSKATNALTIFDSASNLLIGNVQSGGEPMKGNIDEIRITVGVARYNSDGGYTVPVAAFPRS